MNTLGAVAGIALLILAVYFGRNELVRRERDAFRRTVERSVKTLASIKEHAKEFNQREILKVMSFCYIFLQRKRKMIKECGYPYRK